MSKSGNDVQRQEFPAPALLKENAVRVPKRISQYVFVYCGTWQSLLSFSCPAAQRLLRVPCVSSPSQPAPFDFDNLGPGKSEGDRALSLTTCFQYRTHFVML
jgi:hypothetical protein